jgi:ligand-binding sensor domain-containing protein
MRSAALGIAVLSFIAASRDCLTAQALWRPDERVIISDFSQVRAIAASPSLVFAATTHGLTIYDRGAHAWRPPVTALDGYPGALVRVALADPVGDAVWLGTDEGWAHYDAELRQWERGSTAGRVSGLMLDARDPAAGVFLETAVGWMFLPRGALMPIGGQPLPPLGRRIAPLTAEAALNLAPAADALRALILTDQRLRTYTFTCAARTPDRGDLFFGTSGMGVVRMDAATGQWETLRFGLLARGAGGVWASPEGVWVATMARPGERPGITWISADLTSDSLVEGSGATGFACALGSRLVASASALWLACERGLLRIAAGGARLFDAGRGMPSDQVLALAPAPDGVWAGTSRGLALVTRNERAVDVGGIGRPVLSLLPVGDSLWVGTIDGLGLLVPGAADVGVPDDVSREPALRSAIVALALVGDRLVVVTPEQFAWRDAATGAWSLTRARSDLGAVAAIAGDPDGSGVWIGGAAGLAFWDLARGTFQVLYVPNDIPAAVRDLAVNGDYLWVATDRGLVRFDRRAARMGG